ncbi:A/G-specific adenine glycosylase [Pannonibacter tanglangensis]|nr:A/G-specific adenine glycosylase [Pannonibacter sp. XCT-34]
MLKTPALTQQLLAWYDRHARDLPWRVPPHERKVGVVPDPYRVWLSEIMLQQTTVAAVKDYFTAFTAKWPKVEMLAEADADDVMKAWAGLGYYSRARNLKACAETVARDHGGRFPDTEEGLRALPGIGPYTAAAIAAIAFDQPAAVVDGNVERVMSRLRLIETPLPVAKPEIRAAMGELTPQERPGDFAQAVMDLGATICTPKRPACALCPWMEPCAARAAGVAETLPRKAAKTAKPTRTGAAFVLRRAGDGAVALRKRPPKGLLGGMAEVPGSEWAVDFDVASAVMQAPVAANWHKRSGSVGHTFTHFHLEVTVFTAELAAGDLPEGWWWSTLDALEGEALPTVMRKVIAHGLG